MDGGQWTVKELSFHRPLSTIHRPPTCRPRYRAGRAGLMRACRAPARLLNKSQQEESNLQAAVLQTAGAPRPFRRCRHRAEEEGVEPSRHRCSAVFETAAIAGGWLALPLLYHPAAAAGLEPAPFSLTARCPTVGPHRKQSPRQDSNLRSPAPKAGALTRLRHSENPTPVAMAGLEPAFSWFRTRRALRPTPHRA